MQEDEDAGSYRPPARYVASAGAGHAKGRQEAAKDRREAQERGGGGQRRANSMDSLGSVQSTPEMPSKAPGTMEEHAQEQPKSFFTHISQVTGKVVSAKGLPSKTQWGSTAIFCLVKGIRSNNHLVNIHATRLVYNTLSPAWNQEFTFECPESWGVVELVGLKFLVYDSPTAASSFQGTDDFLGGADLDLSSVSRSRAAATFELELGGSEIKARTGLKVKRARITIEITCHSRSSARPDSPTRTLMRSMLRYTRVRALAVKISRAKNLPLSATNARAQCVVRVVMISGEVRELYRSKMAEGSLDPIWEDSFQALFDRDEDDMDEDFVHDEPVLFMIDIYGTKREDEDLKYREHFGSCVVPLWTFGEETKKHRLPMQSRPAASRGLAEPDNADAAAPPPGAVRGTMAPGESHKQQANADGSVWKPKSAFWRKSGGSLESEDPEGLCERMTSSARDLAIRACARAAAAVPNPAKLVPAVLGCRRKRKPRGPKKLHCEIAVERLECAMPFANLIDRPMRITDQEDVDVAMNDPVWRDSMFRRPDITFDFSEPAVLNGMDRIVFISGIVFGASGLARADLFSKSDPYCKIEAVLTTGERLLVHRTQTVWNSLTPSWEEPFRFAAPTDVAQVSRLAFTVFDDDDQAIDKSAFRDFEDDLLGHVHVDISKLKNGELLQENMPLVGAKQKKTSGNRSGFRLTANLSLEVRVERRVQPVYKTLADDHGVRGYKQHCPSRMLKHARYEDPSQQEVFADSSKSAAKEYSRRKFAAEMSGRPNPPLPKSLCRNWLTVPDVFSQAQELAFSLREKELRKADAVVVRAVGLRAAGAAGPGDTAEALQERPEAGDPARHAGPRSPATEAHLCDFTKGCAFRLQKYTARPADLAALHTKFGRHDATAPPAELSPGTARFLGEPQEEEPGGARRSPESDLQYLQATVAFVPGVV